MEASIAIQVLPKVQETKEVVRIVDEVIAYIQSTGLSYQVGAFETTIEGDYNQLMEIVKNCQLIAVKAGAPQVSAYVKIAYNPEGDVLSIEEKKKKHQH
ncbi:MULTISPECIES: thiamine-binding protein [unclassified Enterococcus]|uniref:thiamine-binding protein n=1 Tax=unclassified Enterococcus TaxID=2608891 RepID=UPI0024758E7C|nr:MULTISPECIES: thiamine-binding protein [unclassified Enterococcus]